MGFVGNVVFRTTSTGVGWNQPMMLVVTFRYGNYSKPFSQ